MISIEEARRIIIAALPVRGSEAVLMAEARGRVLAEDVEADATYPSADRSQMDGYAIGAGDAPAFRVVGEVKPGSIPSFSIRSAECGHVFTGAEVPPGTTCVVPQEFVEREGDFIKILRRPDQTFIRHRGVEARPGDVILKQGSHLGPAELAILAQVGASRVTVRNQVRVAHVATGDELVAPDELCTAGKVRDTNSSLIAALVDEAGARLVDQHRCPDKPRELARWVENASAEVLLISGGASVGKYDFGARVLAQAGFDICFEKVNLRPGKPLTFAVRGQQVAFVIPGNPVSHFVCFHVAIRVALEQQPPWEFARVLLGGGRPLKAGERETFCPARMVIRDGGFIAEPRQWSSSGDTFALAGTNALIRVTTDATPGAMVPVLLTGALR